MSSALPLSQHQGSNFIIFHKICLTTAVMLVAHHSQMFMLFKWGSKACWVNIIKESWSFLPFFFFFLSFAPLLSVCCAPLFVYIRFVLGVSLFLNFNSWDKCQLRSELHVSEEEQKACTERWVRGEVWRSGQWEDAQQTHASAYTSHANIEILCTNNVAFGLGFLLRSPNL